MPEKSEETRIDKEIRTTITVQKILIFFFLFIF